MRELREVMRARLRLVVRRIAARVQLHSLTEKAGWQLSGNEFEELDTLEGQLEALLRQGPSQAAWCWLEHVRLLTRQISGLKDGSIPGCFPKSRSEGCGRFPASE